jgi:hypothetical protein
MQTGSKDELLQNIRDWIVYDNEIRELNKGIRERKAKQTRLSQAIMETMKQNEIDEFNVAGGKLMYNKKTMKKPITKSTLTGILAKYYEGDMSQAITMNNYIMANREEIVKESLQRKLNKSSTDSNAQ